MYYPATQRVQGRSTPRLGNEQQKAGVHHLRRFREEILGQFISQRALEVRDVDCHSFDCTCCNSVARVLAPVRKEQ